MKTIIEFIKYIFLLLAGSIKLLLEMIFTPNKKQTIKTNLPTKKVNQPLKKETITITTPDTLPSNGEHTINTKQTNNPFIPNINYIDMTINEVLKNTYNIKVKETEGLLKEEIKDLKERITPSLQAQLTENINHNDFTYIVEKIIKKDIKEHKPSFSKDNETILEEINVVIDSFNELTILNEKELTNTKEEVTELTNYIIASSIATTLSKEEIKEKVNNLLTKKEQTLEEKISLNQTIEDTKKEKTIEQTIKDTIEQNPKDINKEEIIKEQNKLNKKEEEIKESNKEEVKEKEKLKKDNKVKEPSKVIIMIDTFINYIKDKTNKVKDQLEIEAIKPDLETKNYGPIENKINKLLDEIETKLIFYGKDMTKEQKETLENRKDKLHSLRNTIEHKQTIDIKKEEEKLEEETSINEINTIQRELDTLNLDNKRDIYKYKLNSLEELNFIKKQDANTIEKQLIVNKMQRMLNVRTSILHKLPFIKNNHFLQYSKAMLLDANIRHLYSVINRTTIPDVTCDFEEVKHGSTSLYKAHTLSYSNVFNFDIFCEQAIKKHPELAIDGNFNIYSSVVRDNLQNQYQRLNKKQQIVNKKCYRVIKKRVLRECK